MGISDLTFWLEAALSHYNALNQRLVDAFALFF